jgi:hypothetical protein
MNQKTTYEQIMTEKLQHLPLPGLEDAIWARVKEQLDADLPDTDGGTAPPDAPSGGGWLWGAGLFMVVAALVAVILFTKKSNENLIPASVTTQQNTLPSATAEKPAPDLPAATSTKNEQGNVPVLSSGDPSAVPNVVVPLLDSLSTNTAVKLPRADTLPQTAFVLPPTIATDTVPAKKKRGVNGLTDADYRIVPKKKDD